MGRLEVGDKAPNFSVETADGETFELSKELAASKQGVIVYFYPKASTPGCTTEACDFRDNIARLSSLGYTVIGLSPDKIPALEKFRDKQSLTFALGSDADHKVAESYGAWGEKKNYGRVYEGLIRSTIVVGKDGTVAHALYNVRAKGHVERVMKLVADK